MMRSYPCDYPGRFVIEVQFEQPAWIAHNPLRPLPPYGTLGYERDSLTLELHKAHVFDFWTRARDTISRLRCGYPQWSCSMVELTERYLAEHAGGADLAAELAISGPGQRLLPAIN